MWLTSLLVNWALLIQYYIMMSPVTYKPLEKFLWPSTSIINWNTTYCIAKWMMSCTWIVRMASLRVGNRSSSSLLFMTSFRPCNRLFRGSLSLLPSLLLKLWWVFLFLFLSLSWLFSPLKLRDLDLLARLLLRTGGNFLLQLRLKLRDLLLLLIRLFPRARLLLLPLRGWLLLRARLLARDLLRLLPRLRLRLVLLVTCLWNVGSDLTESFKMLADLKASAKLYAMFPLR